MNYTHQSSENPKLNEWKSHVWENDHVILGEATEEGPCPAERSTAKGDAGLYLWHHVFPTVCKSCLFPAGPPRCELFYFE